MEAKARLYFLRYLLTGPLIFAALFNGVSLYHGGQPTTITWGGYVYFSLLAGLLFLGPLLSVKAIEPGQSEREKTKRYHRARISYRAAALVCFLLYFWAAYSEEGPRGSGAPPLAGVFVLLFALPLAGIGVAAGRFAEPKISEEESLADRESRAA